MSVITKFREFRSHALPEQVSHHVDGTREYIQPQPRLGPNQYLTYWGGNQLPGQFIHTMNPHEVWVAVKDKYTRYQNSPQGALRQAGSFNVNMSQENSAQVAAMWRQAWKNAAGKAS